MPVKQGQGQGSAPEAVKVASETSGVFEGWILSCFGKIQQGFWGEFEGKGQFESTSFIDIWGV